MGLKGHNKKQQQNSHNINIVGIPREEKGTESIYLKQYD